MRCESTATDSSAASPPAVSRPDRAAPDVATQIKSQTEGNRYMSCERQRRCAVVVWGLGLLLIAMSFGGGWGRAYGQTAGPPPTTGPAALVVTKTADTLTPTPGSPVTFTITVSNGGGAPALNVEVQDVMPGAFVIREVRATLGTVAVNGQTVRVSIPRLDPGFTVVITIRTELRNSARGTFRNLVLARAEDPNGVLLAEVQADVVLSVGEEDAPPPAPPADTPAAPGRADGRPASGLGETGMETGTIWPLLILGLLLVVLGGGIFWRVRRQG